MVVHTSNRFRAAMAAVSAIKIRLDLRTPNDRLNDKLPQRSEKTAGRVWDTTMNGGFGDAYRHYVASTILANILEDNGYPNPAESAVVLGDLREDDSASGRMDKNNNRAGANRQRASLYSKDFWESTTLDFMNDVARGRVQVMETDKNGNRTGKTRNTDRHDVYREPYEVPYHPEPKQDHDFFNDQVEMIA